MASEPRVVPQLPLALGAPEDQRFDGFVHAPSGMLEQLVELSRGIADASVFLQGASATGKTHLLMACFAEAECAGRHPAYLALRGMQGKVRAASEGLEAADIVLLDDVDAVAGQRDDEVALFDLHNRLRDSGRVLVYAARSVPDTLGLLLPDLRSRLAQCTRWTLPRLDDAGRAELLRRRAALRGLDFDAAALDWMLRRSSRDLHSLATLFEQLDRASLAAQRRLTVPFLRQVFGSD